MKRMYIYFDGGTLHGSFKVFLDEVDDSHLVEHRVYDMDGIEDSNQAEFTVLLRALRWVHMVYPDTSDYAVFIYGDNAQVHKMVGKKLDGIWKGELSTIENFTYLTGKIRERLDRFAAFEYTRLKRQRIVEMLGH